MSRISKNLLWLTSSFFLFTSLAHETLAGKKSFPLIRENFSQKEDIDVRGISQQIAYEFKEESLLRASLSPLLPTRLRVSKQIVDNLEFLGDGVLSLIIRERLLALFPEERRGEIVKLYNSLTENDTLAEVYMKNLGIEKYIPYPERPSCKYCNVVEVIIGAIYQDAGFEKGLKSCRTFIMKILDDHVLFEKLQEISSTIPIPEGEVEESDSSPSKPLPPHPRLQEIIDGLLLTNEFSKENPKSLLNEILMKAWNVGPSYTLSLGRHETGYPIFVAHVVGPQIGKTLNGIGLSEDGAEKDAAKQAINFLVQQELFPPGVIAFADQPFTCLVSNFCNSRGILLTSTSEVLHPMFVVQAKIGVTLVGEGSSTTKKEAEEEAAQRAWEYFIEQESLDPNAINVEKKYKTNLKELFDKGKIPDVLYSFLEEEENQSIRYRFILALGEHLFQAEALSLPEAREEAHKQVFEHLLRNQDMNGE